MKHHKKSKTLIIILSFVIVCGIIFNILFLHNGTMYSNRDFSIEDYTSTVDKDGDGIDDQTDILLSTREYLATNPQYKSEYYENGYPNGKYGVCTDVVGFALKNAGYDLMTLLYDDVNAHPDDYDIEEPDKNIDFRRVKNLIVYFRHTAISLTGNIEEIAQWQGGDIIVFSDHIGIVSNHRNKKGQPFVIHHAYPNQPSYEEDLFGRPINFYGEIRGHFRIS